MSRDMKPFEFKMFKDAYPDILSLFTKNYVYSETGMPVYSDEEIENASKYPMLSLCGPNVFLTLVNEHFINNEVVQQIEDILNNRPCDDKELTEKTMLWYKGELEPGYYMDGNNYAFLNYIKQVINKKGEQENDRNT